MIKNIFIIVLFYSGTLLAEEQGFQGCGQYVIKGVLMKDLQNKKNISSVKYVVNDKTISEMQFLLSEEKDLDTALSYLNQPTEILGEIKKPMDATKGVITHIEKIKIRKPDPLNNTETGIYLKTKMECDKKDNSPN